MKKHCYSGGIIMIFLELNGDTILFNVTHLAALWQSRYYLLSIYAKN